MGCLIQSARKFTHFPKNEQILQSLTNVNFSDTHLINLFVSYRLTELESAE